VQRVLGVEALPLRSDAGDEESVDPLQVRLPGALLAVEPSLRPMDERRYSDSDWIEARRRRDLLATLACASRTTADVAAAATSLGISHRRVWALLRRSHLQGNGGSPIFAAAPWCQEEAPECRGRSHHPTGH
jgi:hypothetical protein